jgi:serine/threonine protein phosphatase PrpC
MKMNVAQTGVRNNCMSLKLQAAAKTDVGRQREQNEDSPYVYISEEQERGLFIVADGMGGYRAGEVASRLAVQKISEALKSFLIPISDQPTIKLAPLSDADLADQATIKLDTTKSGEPATKSKKTSKLAETPTIKTIEDSLKAAVRQANRAIISYGEEQSGARGLGCTVTSALVQDEQAFIVNVGDSRTYLLRNGELTVLTRDHSLVQRLVEEKQITPDEVYTHPQRNLIYRSLGAGHKSVEPDVFHQPLQRGDTLLLCSDGLWEMVRRQDLISVLQQEDDPQHLCDRLIDLANAHGGEDNITAVVVQVRGS